MDLLYILYAVLHYVPFGKAYLHCRDIIFNNLSYF